MFFLGEEQIKNAEFRNRNKLLIHFNELNQYLFLWRGDGIIIFQIYRKVIVILRFIDNKCEGLIFLNFQELCWKFFEKLKNCYKLF